MREYSQNLYRTHGKNTSLVERCTSIDDMVASLYWSVLFSWYRIMQGGRSGVKVLQVSLPEPQRSVSPHCQSLHTFPAMGDIKEQPDGERALDPASDSAAATQPFLLYLVQTLEQTDRDDVASLERSSRTTIACRRRDLNDKNSPLLRLPTELLVTIGYLVIGRCRDVFLSDEEDPTPCRPMQNWWTKYGTLMSIFSRLRHELDTMRSDRVTFSYYRLARSTNLVEKCRKISLDIACYRGISFRGPVLIEMGMYYYAGLSQAAAIAAFLECLLFGRLQKPHVVYVQSKWRGRDENGEGGDEGGPTLFPEWIYVGSARKLSLRFQSYTAYLPPVVEEGPISMDGAKALWKRVRKRREERKRELKDRELQDRI